jgi:hypothetical protein
LYITTDLIVQGSSSLQNITASAVSIGTNTVILNTDTPAVRFAGISVQDSGSNAGVTGSIFWDGLCNRWVYSNPSGIGYSGGMFLSGPRSSTLGSEAPLTCNYIAKSGGGDHLYDSCIIDDGTTVCVNANLKNSGNIVSNGYVQITNATNPSLYINNTIVQWQNYVKSSYNLSFSDAVSDVLTLGYNGSPSFFQGGCVGIGTCTPNERLQVAGAISSTGTATTAFASSSTLDWFSTGTRIISRGSNTTTKGTFTIKLESSDGSNTLNALSFNNAGAACFLCELTAKTIGTNDLKLSNLNYECANYVDGTRGSWLIQEGENDLFIINQISCKKYKFNLIEIK